MYFLNNVDIYPKYFISAGVKRFSMWKGLKYITKTVHKKCTNKYTKSSFIVLIFMILIFYCGNFAFLFHFFDILLSVKFKDLFTIKTLLHVFFLLYKDKLKMQYESTICLLCTNMLHFFVAFFLGRS